MATRGRLFSAIRYPRKALHLESKSSVYTPKGAGSALVIGKIALIMLIVVGVRCQIKNPPFFLSPPEGGLDLVTNRKGAI